MPQTDYALLRPSAKFTPAIYRRRGDVWEGGSESMFTPALKFTLFERFSADVLEVSERMERNGNASLAMTSRSSTAERNKTPPCRPAGNHLKKSSPPGAFPLPRASL